MPERDSAAQENFGTGYNTRPTEVKPGDCFGYKVIAIVRGHGLFWAAYRGPTEWSDQRVLDEGDKVSEETARSLFYAISHCPELRYEH